MTSATEKDNPSTEPLSIEEAARYLGVTTQAVYGAISRGSLKSVVRYVETQGIEQSELDRYREGKTAIAESA